MKSDHVSITSNQIPSTDEIMPDLSHVVTECQKGINANTIIKKQNTQLIEPKQTELAKLNKNMMST